MYSLSSLLLFSAYACHFYLPGVSAPYCQLKLLPSLTSPHSDVPWSKKFSQVSEAENHRFISFISHLIGIIIVHKMMFNIFKKMAWIFCILFYFFYTRRFIPSLLVHDVLKKKIPITIDFIEKMAIPLRYFLYTLLLF